MPIKTHRRFITSSLAALALTLALTSEARAETPPEDIGYDGDGEYDHESRGMMYTGIGLTTTGIVGLGAGSAVVAAMIKERGDFDDTTAFAIAGSLLIPSSVLVHIGIPLWAVGASSPSPEAQEEELSSAIPEFRITGAGGSLHWRF